MHTLLKYRYLFLLFNIPQSLLSVLTKSMRTTLHGCVCSMEHLPTSECCIPLLTNDHINCLVSIFRAQLAQTWRANWIINPRPFLHLRSTWRLLAVITHPLLIIEAR